MKAMSARSFKEFLFYRSSWSVSPLRLHIVTTGKNFMRKSKYGQCLSFTPIVWFNWFGVRYRSPGDSLMWLNQVICWKQTWWGVTWWQWLRWACSLCGFLEAHVQKHMLWNTLATVLLSGRTPCDLCYYCTCQGRETNVEGFLFYMSCNYKIWMREEVGK
jgi:hypothetical protein